MPNVIHRFLGIFIGTFIILHLCNHIVGIAGIDSHIQFMESFRKIYRNAYVEFALLAAIALQLALGINFVFRSWGKRRGFFERAQAISGCYLIYFFLSHVSAVLFGRSTYNLDTNFYFAAAGMHVGKLYFAFIPHYFLAVLAFFTHVACALHYHVSEKGHAAAANRYAFIVIFVGGVISALIVMSLAGIFYEVDVPKEYLEFFNANG
jgi:succinate dehydrogenase/fumarate reductase cytochrome b subunit